MVRHAKQLDFVSGHGAMVKFLGGRQRIISFIGNQATFLQRLLAPTGTVLGPVSPVPG